MNWMFCSNNVAAPWQPAGELSHLIQCLCFSLARECLLYVQGNGKRKKIAGIRRRITPVEQVQWSVVVFVINIGYYMGYIFHI